MIWHDGGRATFDSLVAMFRECVETSEALGLTP